MTARLLYLDLNCFNRPFDDQDQERVARETSAVFAILARIVSGEDRLAWSEILEFENSRHPRPDRRTEIGSWRHLASVVLSVGPAVEARAEEWEAAGLAPLDAAHLASAEIGGCERFLTCDDRLLRKARAGRAQVRVLTPVEYLEEIHHGRTDRR